MKKYPIIITDDYTQYEEWANEGDKYWQEKIRNNPKQLELCKKWKGKEITLAELEDLIDEFGEIVFNGKTIEI